jgi:hypothetical protein
MTGCSETSLIFQMKGVPSSEISHDKIRIADVFPDLFQAKQAMADGESPLVYVGSMLSRSEIHMLPVEQGIRPRKDRTSGITLYGALAGYSLFEWLSATAPSDFSENLWRPCRDVAVWIGSADFTNPLASLLRVFDLTRFGAARVQRGKEHALITLSDLVSAMSRGALYSEMRVSEVGSTPVAISSKATIREAVELMLNRRIRRLFLGDNPGKFVSGGSILGLIFDPGRLQKAGAYPQSWRDLAVTVLTPNEAQVVLPGTSLSEASKLMGPKPDDCLVTPDGKVISRWDLIIKPWKLGRLGYA